MRPFLHTPPAALFPDCVRGAFSDGNDPPDALLAGEAELVRNAVTQRQREFALGRTCARRALTQLGVAPVAIGADATRAPIWPPGIVGSITHCRGFVGALVARVDCLRAIGFDSEIAEPLAPDLTRLICTDAEMQWTQAKPLPGPGWPKVLFSAKEAVHKCISPLFGVMLDFLDVSLFPGGDDRALVARPAAGRSALGTDLSLIHVRFAVTGPFVFACASMKPVPADAINPVQTTNPDRPFPLTS